MTFTAAIVISGLLIVLCFIYCVRNIRRRRILRALFCALLSLALLSGVGGALVMTANLGGYRQLTVEQPAGALQFTRIGNHQFNGVFTTSAGARSDFALRGDEWQIDARIIKWRALANILGFDTTYRLERISGRYTRIDDELSQPRTVYPLNPPDRVDVWELLHRFRTWLPGFDALYGNAAYLPMADGAQYAINVSQSGLIVRPLNQAARVAVGGWQ